MTGTIFNIQRFCLNDGPGIRTTVFMKGCPLHCAWCHNPESLSFEKELLYNAERCVGCRKCETVCKQGVHIFGDGAHLLEREKCVFCGECAAACQFGALSLAGTEMTAAEIVAASERDINFYRNSGGGVTLSGGEPMAQFELSLEVASALYKKGISVAIETSGTASGDKYRKIAEFTDLFLFDLKLSSEELYKKYTGGRLETVLENLKLISSLGKDVILRLPIIPDVNGDDAHFEFAAAVANGYPTVKSIEIMPYHALGEEKQRRLGREAVVFRAPDKNEIDGYIEKLSRLTDKPVKRG